MNENYTGDSYSSIPKFVGVLGIIIGGWYLFVTGMEILSGEYDTSDTYMIIIDITGNITSIWLVFIGFSLFNYQDWARKHFNYYTLYSFLNALAIFLHLYKSQEAETITSLLKVFKIPELFVLGLMVFMAPYINLILVLLLNMKRSKNSLVKDR